MSHLAWEGEMDQLPRLSVEAEEEVESLLEVDEEESFLGGGTGEGEGEGSREEEETDLGDAPVGDFRESHVDDLGSQDLGGGEGGVLGRVPESGEGEMYVEDGGL